MKLFEVAVEKGDQHESMKIEAANAEQAKTKCINTFYYDGWHAVSAKEV